MSKKTVDIPCNIGDIVWIIEDNNKNASKWYVAGIINYGDWKVELRNNTNKYKYKNQFMTFEQFTTMTFKSKREAMEALV